MGRLQTSRLKEHKGAAETVCSVRVCLCACLCIRVYEDVQHARLSVHISVCVECIGFEVVTGEPQNG